MAIKKEEPKKTSTALTRPAARPTPPPAAKDLEKVPEYLAQAAAAMPGAGLENVERQDMTIPRLGLCQSMTPQRKKSEASYIAGLEEGQFFNTITNEIYGEAVKVIPLHFFKTRLLFNPIDEGGGLRCQSQDNVHGVGDPGGECAKCPMQAFTDDGKPQCNQLFNYPVIILPPDGSAPGMDSLAALSLKSTGLKVAKRWNSLMRLRTIKVKGEERPAPSFSGVYEVRAVEARNGAGQVWHTHVIDNAGWVDEHQLRVAVGLYNSVKDMQAQGRLRVEGTDEPLPDDPDTHGDGREM